jgi:exonuclease SbcC
MLIDALRISAFRGIRTELPLDLTARLTLLHAPNGTGKTSVCDAAEWVLSGGVSRLASALADSPTEGVRNLFAQELPTFVEADLTFPDSTLKVRHIGLGADGKLEHATPTWRKLEQSKLLERLAPTNLSAGSTRQQNLNRASWFRAVRLLDAPGLDLLLDDTKEAQGVRGLLFSNLFGVSELQSREQTLAKVRDSMMRPGRIESEATQLQTQIQEIERSLSPAGERASEPFWAAARQHLATAAQFLGAAQNEDSSPKQLASALESIRASEEERVSRVRSAFQSISGEWDRFQALAAEISAIEKEQATDTSQIAQTRGQHETLVAAARQSVTAVADSVRREERLRGLSPDRLVSKLDEALTQWRDTGGDSDTSLELSALRAAEQTATAQSEALERQRTAFAESAQNVPRWLELVGTFKAGEARIAQLEVPTAEAVATNDGALKAAQDELRRIEAESARLAAPLERLKTEGRRLLESMPDEHHCLLCAHDYKTSTLLREAIDAGLQALPAALTALATQKTAQEAIAAEAGQRKIRWDAVIGEVAQLNRTMTEARAELRTAADALRATGTDLPELSAPDFLGCFQAAEAEFERKAEEERRSRSKVMARRIAGDLLSEVREGVWAASQTLRSITTEEFPDIAVASLPPSRWSAEVARLTNQVAGALQQAAEKVRASREAAQDDQEKADAQLKRIAEITAAMNARTRRLGELRSAVVRFTEQWTIAAGETPPSREALDALPQRSAQATEQLAKTAVELRSATENIAKAEEASERERQVITNRSKLTELRAAAQRLTRIENRRGELDRAVSLLREAKEAFINQQIRPLCNVITALYLRAQSNAFITAIGTDDQSGAHRWTATADDCRLEAIAQLSQGQRQDFALAVFLARARDIRGTFFLDEPLLHLDDLNRVALLDVLRVLVTERADQPLRFVITTSSNALVRHFREKFSLLRPNDHGSALRIYRLSGNPRDGVSATEEKLPSR